VAQADAFDQGSDNEKQDEDVGEPGSHAQPNLAPIRTEAPKGAVPEALGKKEQRQDAQTDGDAQKQEGPIHDEFPQAVNLKSSTPGRLEIRVTDGGFLRKMYTHGARASSGI
jgi:hypothetical protein